LPFSERLVNLLGDISLLKGNPELARQVLQAMFTGAVHAQ